MGDNTEANNEVLVQGAAVRENITTDVFEFLPIGEGKKIRVQVLVKICGEESEEDLQTDISVDLEEAVTKAMVGHFEFLKRSRYSEYEGTIKLD